MLVTDGAITAIRNEFEKDVKQAISIRENSSRKDKERLFGEMMIYEDSIRIMNRVLDRIYRQ